MAIARMGRTRLRSDSCGLTTRVEAHPSNGDRAEVTVTSECPRVTALVQVLAGPHERQALWAALTDGPELRALRAQAGCCTDCPVAEGLSRLIRATLGLARPHTVQLTSGPREGPAK